MVNLRQPLQVDDALGAAASLGARIACWLYPSRCRRCLAAGDGGDDLCAECRMTLPWNGPACPRCALPAAPAPCPGCAGAPAALWRSIAAFRYAEPVSDWIHAFKFHRRLADGRLLGTLLGRVAARDLEARPPGLAPQAIVPIPLHRRRLRSRGFDQNRELLRAVVRATPGVPVLHALQRVRDTAHQARLNLRERRGNLNEAFSVRRRALDRLPAHIAVFDDVVTTGATLSAACAPLQAAGVERIECWTVARTPG